MVQLFCCFLNPSCHPDPEISGGRPPKNFFWPFGPHFGLKIRGGGGEGGLPGPLPGSATAKSHAREKPLLAGYGICIGNSMICSAISKLLYVISRAVGRVKFETILK